ncbi:hypothetical protein [Herbaspirillum hiltneri]|uniref:hypothetical protein n=1 Tax=Herbaspirillum hiltneri TaxID=341045 RepID=UPI00118745B6|nr:hypothetical protein [Herbaspirillum hiltneri]
MLHPIFYVDFNEMVDATTVLLSQRDTKVDSSGRAVELSEGMVITVYMDDVDDNGHADKLIAHGEVTRNVADGWSSHVKWCCRIDDDGIRPQSKIG